MRAHVLSREWLWGAGVAVIGTALAAVGTLGGGGAAAAVLGAALAGLIAVRTVGPRAEPGDGAAEKATDASAQSADVIRDGRRLWAPLWIAVGWLLGTYAAFWGTGLATKVEDAWVLTAFVAAATGALAIGYAVRIVRYPPIIRTPVNTWPRQVRANRLIVVAAIYMAAFGLTQIAEYGATGIGDVITKIQDPAAAYQAKFGIFETQLATNRVSPMMQAVTLTGGFYGVLAPMLVVYWRRLTIGVRVAGVAGLSIYAVFFLFIGTQKGLGDLVVMLLAGAVAGALGTWWHGRPSRGQRKTLRYTVLAVVAFAVYMVSAQAGRADIFGTRDVTPPSPAVAAVVGDHVATGVAATLFYPTHGYLGLSYNLGTPFVWSKGLGSSKVVSSYASQYLDITPQLSYPDRTEARTGWPAGRYWSTAYPWLASDLTYPGVVALMLIVGWFLARMWVEGAIMRDGLALVIFGQLAIAVAYIPANNQIWTSRPTTIGFVTLVAMYLGRIGIRRTA